MLLLASSAAATETDWVEVAPDVSIRIVSSDSVSDEGTVWMGLEVDMPADTKTYWRVPGESGIPLVIDTTGSQGVTGLEVAWPFPKRETSAGYLDHAFYGHVLIPFQVAVEGDAAVLAADITMGICSDICIPAMAEFELHLDLATPARANDLRIRQALANVPLLDEGTGLLGEARFDAETERLMVEFEDAGFDPSSMIAEIVDTPLLFGEPEVGPGEVLSFPLMGRAEPSELGNAQARFTFDTPEGPYEIVRPLVADGAAQ